MTLNAVVGQAQALDGREASLQAIHHALNRIGAVAPGLGIVIASHQYQPRDIASGVSGLLGDIPVIGFSSPVGLTATGSFPHSVVVGILGGDGFEAHSHWLPGYAQSSREAAMQLGMLAAGDKAQDILVFSDGFNGDAEQFCQAMSDQPYRISGALSSGDTSKTSPSTFARMGRAFRFSISTCQVFPATVTLYFISYFLALSGRLLQPPFYALAFLVHLARAHPQLPGAHQRGRRCDQRARSGQSLPRQGDGYRDRGGAGFVFIGRGGEGNGSSLRGVRCGFPVGQETGQGGHQSP